MKTINTQNISEATETEEHVSKPVILLKKATTTEEIINTAKENIKIAVNFVKNGATREELIALLNTTTKNILNSMSCELGEGCFHYGVNTPKKTMVNFLADTIIQKTKNIYAETKTADTVTCAVETQQQKTKKKVKNFYLIYFEDAVSLNNCVVFRGTYSEARSYAFHYKRAWQKTEKIEKIERAKNFNTGEFLTSDKYTLEDVAAMLENASIDKNGKPILSEDFIFPSQVKTSETVAEQPQEPEFNSAPVHEPQPEQAKKSVSIEDALKDRDAWGDFRNATMDRLREYLKQKGIEKAPAGRSSFVASMWLADNATKPEDIFEHLLHLSKQGLKNVHNSLYSEKFLFHKEDKISEAFDIAWQIWFAFCAIDAGREEELKTQQSPQRPFTLNSSILKSRIEARDKKIKDTQEAEELEAYWEKASLLKSEIEKCSSREEIKKLLANADGKMCRYALVNLLPYRWKTEKTNEELIEEYFSKHFPISEPTEKGQPERKIKPVEKNKTPKADGQQLLIDFSDSQEIIKSKTRTKKTRIKHDYSNQLLINFDEAA
ncbi:MAG: hypothetical protein IJQ47_00830 [Synergistaceae bacterium]|nr:hypothetical protein [Synergistaceae bacterium]